MFVASTSCRSGCAVQPDIRGISSWRQVQQKNLTYAGGVVVVGQVAHFNLTSEESVRDVRFNRRTRPTATPKEGAGSDAHEDGGGGEGEAHEGAPTPDQKDPAFFKQAAQVEVAAKKGVE